MERFHIPHESLEEHLSLLNLVNFGGGCYAVYAELRGDTVFVLKELFGDTFRSPPRLTPLEARAIRLALDFVGPMIAADTRSPLDNVRAKLAGDLRPVRPRRAPPPPPPTRPRRRCSRTLNEGISDHRLVEIEYQKEGEDAPTTRVVEPYTIERELPYWYVHAFDRTRDAQRSFRLDRMRARVADRRDVRAAARVPARNGCATRRSRASGTRPRSPAGARERGARMLVDGSALADQPVGSLEWLAAEILGARGDAIVLEPEDLRAARGRARASALLDELAARRRLA